MDLPHEQIPRKDLGTDDLIVRQDLTRKWFKAKRYGYGWYPSSWQGWAVFLTYLFAVLTDATFSNNHSHSVSDFDMSFFPRFFILTVFLIIICEAKGEPAKWRWKGK